MIDRYTLLKHLPPYTGKYQQIAGKQDVSDIINEILDAHNEFAPQYNEIALYFNKSNVQDICKSLYRFCKSNIRYKQESEAKQTTKSPAAMLAHGYGDCKHYASFCGGVLDALNRAGRQIKWHYRFASYNLFNNTPEHVFIIVDNNGKEIWIDPTPGAENVKPTWQTDKRIKATTMPLYRVSGIEEGQTNYPISDALESITDEQIEAAVQLLLKYGIMDVYARVNDKALIELQGTIDSATFEELARAMHLVNGAAIGGLFKNIWRGVKKVVLAIPRNAYLGLVGINAFGYATKLHHALYNDNGTYTTFKDKLYDIWHNKLGGDFSKLEGTIKDGFRKKAILGSVNEVGAAQATIPAWVAVASACIAAIMPLVKAFLDAKAKEQGGINYNNIDPLTGLPYGVTAPENDPGRYDTGQGFDVMQWLEDNPLLVAGGIVGIMYLLKKRA